MAGRTLLARTLRALPARIVNVGGFAGCKNRHIQYFDSRSLVRRMMNLETMPPSSFNFFSHSAFTASVASASRPRMIAFSKFLRKSFLVPKKLGFAKLSSEKYSDRSFYVIYHQGQL